MTDGPKFGEIASLLSGVRFTKFASVGVLGAVFDTAVLVGLTEGLGVVPEVATLVGIETAILVMFAVNERWTFAGEGRRGRRSLLGRLKRSHVVRAGGSLTQFVVFVAVYRLLFVSLTPGDVGFLQAGMGALGVSMAGLDLWLIVAKGTGIGFGMIVNYVAESLFTWRVGMEPG